LYRILIKLDSSAKTTKGHKYCWSIVYHIHSLQQLGRISAP
jgi:hypothetical protein